MNNQIDLTTLSIRQDLSDLGVRFQLTHDVSGSSDITGKINLEKVELKNLSTVVSLFNELDDCVK